MDSSFPPKFALTDTLPNGIAVRMEQVRTGCEVARGVDRMHARDGIGPMARNGTEGAGTGVRARHQVAVGMLRPMGARLQISAAVRGVGTRHRRGFISRTSGIRLRPAAQARTKIDRPLRSREVSPIGPGKSRQVHLDERNVRIAQHILIR
jgi:hypothetical protein